MYKVLAIIFFCFISVSSIAQNLPDSLKPILFSLTENLAKKFSNQLLNHALYISQNTDLQDKTLTILFQPVLNSDKNFTLITEALTQNLPSSIQSKINSKITTYSLLPFKQVILINKDTASVQPDFILTSQYYINDTLFKWFNLTLVDPRRPDNTKSLENIVVSGNFSQLCKFNRTSDIYILSQFIHLKPKIQPNFSIKVYKYHGPQIPASKGNQNLYLIHLNDTLIISIKSNTPQYYYIFSSPKSENEIKILYLAHTKSLKLYKPIKITEQDISNKENYLLIFSSTVPLAFSEILNGKTYCSPADCQIIFYKLKNSSWSKQMLIFKTKHN